MKTIICPSDFSQASNNAIEYAARLAQMITANLEIINIRQVSPASPVLSAIEVIGEDDSYSEMLYKITSEISQTFNIQCSYKVEVTAQALDRTIAQAVVHDNTFIVMGTNGTDDLYQYIFGTYSYQVIKKAKCPVLIIPENVVFAPVKKIIIPWEYQLDVKFIYEQIKTIYNSFHPEITFVHISREKSLITDDVFSALKEEIYTYIDNKNAVSFDHLYVKEPEQFVAAINDYMTDNEADALAITYYDRGKLKNIFHGTITKELTEVAQYPLLAIHQEV